MFMAIFECCDELCTHSTRIKTLHVFHTPLADPVSSPQLGNCPSAFCHSVTVFPESDISGIV